MSEWRTAPREAQPRPGRRSAPPDGKHEVVDRVQRLALADTVAGRSAGSTSRAGFDDDMLVTAR